jgi:RHS repeat-associated protein
MGHVVKYAYESGQLSSVTEPGEASPRWQFKYDGAHQLTTMTDGRGGKTVNEYNGAHQVVSQTDPAERTLTFEYEPFHTRITNHASGGSVTDEFFTSADLPSSITRGFGTASATTESFSYDSAGNVLSTTDGDSHTTKYGYDAAGNRTSTIDPDERETKWTYDATHDVESETTPRGETTTIERDVHGNAIKVARPAPGSETQVTKYKYGPHGELEAATDPLERTTKYEYDSNGDRTAEIDPEGDKRTWAYDLDSYQTSTVSPRGHVTGAKESKFTTSIERDAQERPIKLTDALKHETKYAYDANGNLESETDPLLNATSFTYDADNEPVKVKRPDGTVTETGYDGAGRVISETDGNKRVTKYVRNAVGEVTEVIDPLSRKTLKEYDAAGNLTKVTDAAGRTTTYKYDPANQLTEVSYSGGTTPTVKYEYNADGRRTKMIDGTGTSKYAYDQLDRLTESENGHGATVGYEYDLADQQTKITYPGSKSVLRAFDKAGRLESVTDWLEHTTKFGYDADSDQTSTTFPAASGNVDQFAFEADDAMESATMKKGAEVLASLEYTRNKALQVTKATTKGLPGEEKPAFSYDENSRLSKGAGIKYGYDAANNATTIGGNTYLYDSADELERAEAKKATVATYSFDELGERTKTKPSTGPATSYGYDQAGDLTSVTRPKEGEIAAIEDSYGNDGDGLRASQTVSGTTSYMTWDVAEALPLLLSDGSSTFVYGPSGLPIEQVSGETVQYLHHDQQGSTRMITGASGTVAATTTFDAYGNKLGSTGSATTALGYDGQYTNADTGLIYLRARAYDPATGQFLSVDPLAASTREPYAYAGDEPVGASDPSGLSGFFGTGIGPDVGPDVNWGHVGTALVTRDAGFWDGVTGGLTAKLRGALGWNGGLDTCSAEYREARSIGGYTNDAATAASLIYSGIGLVAGIREGLGSLPSITFGHGARHLAETGLDSGAVESVIQSQVEQAVASADATGSFWGRVVVQGRTIEYRAHTLEDGTINVGTYYPPK